MKLIDILKNVKKDVEQSLDIEGLFSEMFGQEVYSWDIDYSKFYEDDLLKLWMVIPRYDSDSYVGVSAMYLRGELIGTHTLQGRKGNAEYEFLSQKCVDKLRAYLLTLKQDSELPKMGILTDAELQEDLEPTFEIYYTDCLMVSEGYWEGNSVKVFRHYPEGHRAWDNKSLRVVLDSGEERIVQSSEVKLKMLVEGV